MWDRPFKFFLTIILALTFLPLLPSEGFSAIIVVTPGSGPQAMEHETDNVCTLHEAIANAKANTEAFPDCEAGDGTDTVKLQAETYNINVKTYWNDTTGNSAFGPVEDFLVLEGKGADKTILLRDPDAADDFRFFYLDGENAYIRIVDLTMRGGRSGNKHGGAIYNDGMSVSIEGSVLTDNISNKKGGAVFSKGAIKSTRSLIYNNSAEKGGAFFLNGSSGGTTLQLSNTTVTENKATAKGGGIFLKKGFLQLNFDTIAKNEAPDGGGIFLKVDDDVHSTVKGVIIANNTENNCNRAIENVHSSLSSDDTCGMDEADGDAIGDPKLTELANHGGATLTLALMADSPALDQGVVAPVMSPCGNLMAGSDGRVDQRGATRPYGDDCDWGAHERGICGDGFKEPGLNCDVVAVAEKTSADTSGGSTLPGGPSTPGDGDSKAAEDDESGGCPFPLGQLHATAPAGTLVGWLLFLAWPGVAWMIRRRKQDFFK